jgi:hypothetical protein
VVNQDLAVLRDKVKEYLPQYLQSLGLPINKQMKCLNPNHKDDHPSMGLIPKLTL